MRRQSTLNSLMAVADRLSEGCAYALCSGCRFVASTPLVNHRTPAQMWWRSALVSRNRAGLSAATINSTQFITTLHIVIGLTSRTLI